jgi:hypothetical protein
LKIFSHLDNHISYPQSRYYSSSGKVYSEDNRYTEHNTDYLNEIILTLDHISDPFRFKNTKKYFNDDLWGFIEDLSK